jgi:hypothetical protein
MATSYSKYYGTKGDLVRRWQKELNKKGAGLKVDGIWGNKTESAYNRWGNGMTVDEGTTSTKLNYRNEVDELIKRISDITNETLPTYTDLTVDEAKGQATNQYKGTFENLLANTQKGLDLDAERRGIFNSNLAAGIMADKKGALENSYNTDVATLAQQLVSNSQASNLTKREADQAARTNRLNEVQALLKTYYDKIAFEEAEKARAQSGRGGGRGGNPNNNPSPPSLGQQYNQIFSQMLNYGYNSGAELAGDYSKLLDDIETNMGSAVRKKFAEAAQSAYMKKYYSTGSKSTNKSSGTGKYRFGTGGR